MKPFKLSQGTHLLLSQAVIALHLCFDQSLSNEPQWAEVNTQPAGFTKTSGDTDECEKLWGCVCVPTNVLLCTYIWMGRIDCNQQWTVFIYIELRVSILFSLSSHNCVQSV